MTAMTITQKNCDTHACSGIAIKINNRGHERSKQNSWISVPWEWYQ